MRRIAAVFCFVLAAMLLVRGARAEPVRLLVAASHARGVDGEQPLRHTHDDARRVRDVLVQLGGVRAEDATLLDEPSPAELFGAIDRARAIAESRRGDDVTLVLYFSGHGDRESIHLGPAVVPIAELQARVAAVPAALKIVVLDACRNVQLRPKGVGAEPPFAISLTPRAATGAVWLHASADGEAAQESDDLGGAIFTHYWTDGLRGAADANGDARVTLSESYDFAYDQTLFRSARGSGVLQRPAASFAIDEAFPVVLTRTSTTSALRFPRSADTEYLVYALGSHSIAGEVWASPDRAVRIALPAGRYVIQRRASGSSGALETSLGAGQQRDLAASDFRPFNPETLAQKGGALVVHPSELSLGYGVRRGALFDVGQVLRARYAYRFGALAISLGVEGGLGAQSTNAESVHVDWLGASARLELWLPITRATELRLGAGPAGAYVAQRLARQDAARVALAGYATSEAFSALAWGGDATIGARWLVSTQVAVGIDLDGRALFAQAEGSPRGYLDAGLTLSVGYSF